MNSDEKSSAGEGQVADKRKRILRISSMIGIVLLVTLVVAVAIVLNNKVSNECLAGDNSYDVSVCVYGVYDDDGKDAAVVVYDKAIDKAYNNSNYTMFYDLLIDRAIMLVSRDGDCATAVNSIEDNRVEELPVSNDKGVFYSEVIGLAINCNENEMEDFYKSKLMEVNNSGEIEEYSF